MIASDEEYLKRIELPNMEYNITNNRILITNNNTSFCRHYRIEKLSINDILSKYTDLCILAKEKKIKIARTRKFKKFVLKNWGKYETEIKEYNILFDKMINEFLKVKARKIHYGCCDDVVLNNAEKIMNEYQTVYYRTSYYSQITEIYKTLLCLIDVVKKSDDACSIGEIHI
jgi:hypothetical protein